MVLKFFLHGDKIKETPMGVGGKGHENIDIAFRAKVVSQSRAKKGQFSDLPPATKVGEFVLRKLKRYIKALPGPGAAVKTIFFCTPVLWPAIP